MLLILVVEGKISYFTFGKVPFFATLVLISIFLMISVVEHLFICTLAIYIFCGKMSFHVLCPVFDWVIYFVIELFVFYILTPYWIYHLWNLDNYWILEVSVKVSVYYAHFYVCLKILCWFYAVKPLGERLVGS